MKKRALVLLAVTAVLTAVLGQAAMANQETSDKKDSAATAKSTRWQGHIVRLSPDKSTMSIRGGRGGGSFEREVSYDDSTKWTKQGKKAEQSDFKEGSFVIVVGHLDGKGGLHASRVDLRAPR